MEDWLKMFRELANKVFWHSYEKGCEVARFHFKSGGLKVSDTFRDRVIPAKHSDIVYRWKELLFGIKDKLQEPPEG